MSYRVRRVDPYWIKSPVLPVIAILGLGAALALVSRGMTVPAIVAAFVGGAAVVASTRPAISAVLGTLGLIGGLTTFFIVPNGQNAAMPISLRLLSAVLFTLFYAVLMDGIVLVISVLYNLFAGAAGLGGFTLDLEDDGGAGED